MGRILSTSLALLLFFGLAAPAGAVVIDGGSGTGNTTAPNNDPGWANVGTLNDGSAVYLGDRWVITAAHVQAGGAVNFGGKSYQIVQNPDLSFGTLVSNPTGFSLSPTTDLALFRLATDPGLPSLTIADSTAPVGSLVTMIGAGNSRDAKETFWKRTPVPGDNTIHWAKSTLGQSNAQGYFTTGARTMRWGFNVVDSSTITISTNTGDNMLAQGTFFAQGSGIPYEAQVTNGDSGGGVFSLVSGKWELTGIINSISKLQNQPENTVVFGNQSFFADLASYKPKIEEIINPTAASAASVLAPLKNLANASDVNGDGSVTAIDAALLINQLNAVGPGPLVPTMNGPYFDVNGDGQFTAADIMQVINDLNALNSPAIVTSPVPEPSSFALAAAALAGVSLLGLRRLRRS